MTPLIDLLMHVASKINCSMFCATNLCFALAVVCCKRVLQSAVNVCCSPLHSALLYCARQKHSKHSQALQLVVKVQLKQDDRAKSNNVCRRIDKNYAGLSDLAKLRPRAIFSSAFPPEKSPLKVIDM